MDLGTKGRVAIVQEPRYYVPGDCRLIRERIVTPSSNVIFKSRRVCR